MTPQIIALIAFAGTMAFVVGVGFFLVTWLGSERTAVEKRFHKLSSNMAMPEYQKQALTYLKKETDWRQYSFFAECPPLLNLPELFEQAGMKTDVGRWLLLVISIGGAVTCLTWMLNLSILIVLLAAVCSFGAPYLYVLMKRKQRLAAFEEGFAQSLEILGRSLRAGHPLTMGLQMVSSEMPEPLSSEFGRVFYEQQMGMHLEDSLRRMAKRVPLLDLRFFVLSVLIHRQTGGDLAEVLDNLSHVIRERFKVLGQVAALTAEGRLSGWVLSILPVAVFFMISVINPTYLDTLMESDIGRKMLYFAIFLQVVGMMVIRKIVRIQV
ncbi:MAG: type II secretion system F family protein [Candidatus Omnitrophica bacterium]|nr:type II secretion system F family protein [Candidatus Omnitrophota bacterium]